MGRFLSTLRAALPYIAEPLSFRPPVVQPNAMLPRPLPAAPLSRWTSTDTRTAVSTPAPDAKSPAILRGWTYAAPHPDDPALLFFNGNTMGLDEYDPFYANLAALGAEVSVFDYRGFGFSTGAPDVMTYRRDALHLYQTLLDRNPSRPLIVFGYSLGTAMATLIAARHPVSALILAGTIASAEEEIPVYAHDIGLPDRLVSLLVPSGDMVETLDEIHYIAHSTAPLLMIHGEDDAVVPIAQGLEVFAASPSVLKQFVSLPQTDHSQTLESLHAFEAIRAFLQTLKTHAWPRPTPHP